MDIQWDYKKDTIQVHHHEVATAGQCEIDIKYDYMTNAADAAQSYKYVIRNVAQKYGKVATMMPKPIAMDQVLACMLM